MPPKRRTAGGRSPGVLAAGVRAPEPALAPPVVAAVVARGEVFAPRCPVGGAMPRPGDEAVALFCLDRGLAPG